MFDTFIAADSPLAINIDHDTRTDIIERVQTKTPDTYPDNIYDRAQVSIWWLRMRFLTQNTDLASRMILKSR